MVAPADGGFRLVVGGVPVGTPVAIGSGVRPTNLACAVAVALRLGVPAEVVRARLDDLPSVANRLTSGTAASGVVVLDDTFNSNPAGAAAALRALAGTPVPDGGRRAVVTPGMVELGPRQAAGEPGLRRGGGRGGDRPGGRGPDQPPGPARPGLRALRPTVVGTRDEAVAWVRGHLGPGDAVLYENDLPDHYP